ncbi:MAG: hypothetical protein ACK4UJ_02915 [Leptonema sp. (in: bacteria)]
MDSKKIILITLAFLFGIIILIYVYRIYPSILNLAFRFSIKEREIPNQTKKIIYYPIADPKEVWIFILDKGMDSYGNSYHIESNLGIELAEIFLKNQFLPIFYKRLDSHQHPSVFFSIQKLSDEFREIFNSILKSKSFEKKPISIFALGQGCTVFLNSLSKFKEIDLITKVYLVNCGYPDSLLSFYGNLIFDSMKFSKVEEEILIQARKEWQEWYSLKNYESYTEEKWKKEQEEFVKNKIHPDLISFRKTIRNFQKEENMAFLKEAKEIYFYPLLEVLLKRKNMKVFHLISEFDEEMPEEIFQEIKKNSLKYTQLNYHLRVLKNTNHLLYYLEQKPRSPIEVAFSRNLFGKKISKYFINNLN